MRLGRLKPEQYREMPWRNGGGSTTEIAISPQGAALGAGAPFLWRVSMARVEQDGPFSTFAGYDRTLVLLQGGGVQLSFGADAPPVTLSAPLQRCRFAGEWETHCLLVDGAVRDFNVIVDRKRGRAAVESVALAPQPRTMELHGRTTLFFVAQGAMELALADAAVRQRATQLETLRIDREDGCAPTPVRLSAAAEASHVLVIDIAHLGPP